MFSPKTPGMGFIPCKEATLGSQYVLRKDSLHERSLTLFMCMLYYNLLTTWLLCLQIKKKLIAKLEMFLFREELSLW